MAHFSASGYRRLIRHANNALNEVQSSLSKVDSASPDCRKTLASLKTLLNNKYKEFQSRIQEYCNMETLPGELTEAELDETVTAWEALHINLFTAIDSRMPNSEPNSISTPTPVTNNLVSLPRLDIKPFDGKFENWPHFYARFDSLVHSNKGLTPVQKFQYLLSLLQDAPRQAVSHLNLTDANYAIALECLIERFHNPRRLIFHHCEHLLKLPTFDSKSTQRMRTFLDQFSSNSKALFNIPDVDVFQAVFTTHLLGLLDLPTRTKFESQYNTPLQFPSCDNVIEFLKSLVVQKENTTLTSDTPDYGAIKATPQKRRIPSTLVTSPSGATCPLCTSPAHKLFVCKEFMTKTPKERYATIKQHNYCPNCLGNHTMSRCQSKNVCKICSKRHHSLLHFPHAVANNQLPAGLPESNSPHTSSGGLNLSTSEASTLSTSLVRSSSTVLMSTCLIKLKLSSGNFLIVRAILDSASHVSFVSERCAQLLKVRRYQSPVTISGIGHNLTQSSGACNLSLATLSDIMVIPNHDFLILPKITSNSPIVQISPSVREKMNNFQLADPTFDTPSGVDVLLSADATARIIKSAPIPLGNNLPFMMETVFGFVLIGQAPPLSPTCNLSCVDDQVLSYKQPVPALVTSQHDNLVASLQRFWELEKPPSPPSFISEDDEYCEQFYIKTTTRTPTGRYVVRLPFKDYHDSLGDSHGHALKRLYALERKFKADSNFHNKYVEFMRDYESQNHMRPISDSDTRKYFIPHHGIFKSHDPNAKIRVVFDASAKSSTCISLNEVLHPGRALQTLIPDVLTLFRLYPYCFSSDICQMYRQIRVHEMDQPYQCILWRESPTLPIKTYYLTTVTYGVTSAPFLALRTLAQLAMDEGHMYPKAALVLQNNVFVDDIITGAETLDDAVKLRCELVALLEKGGFVLKKWSANHRDILAGLPVESDTVLESYCTGPTRLLGILWDPVSDTFSFDSFSNGRIPPIESSLTKRVVLSQIAALYDPCGFLAPITMKAKCFLQKLWLHPLDWDTPLPDALLQEWHSFRQALPALSHITLSRPLFKVSTSCQLHGFSDASKVGYAAVLYLRTNSDNPHVTLIASKTRVAPIKTQTLPRLELLGAHLLANLAFHYLQLLKNYLCIESVFLWSDSMIVLDWLKIPPVQLKTFVANRVSQILEWTELSMWRHVPSQSNSADIASRGTSPNTLLDQPLWWKGPDFLTLPECDWPQPSTLLQIGEGSQEIIKSTLVATANISDNSDLFTHISSWSMLIRVVAKILCWVSKATQPPTGPPLIVQYEHSFNAICHHIQQTSFANIITNLQTQQPLPKHLARLALFIDTSGLIRVKGRFPSHSSCPILLPKKHRLVFLLIDHYHFIFGHAGANFVQAQLTKKVWILAARQTIRSRVCACVRCFRNQPRNEPPLMGDLPEQRIVPSPPFFHTGMDFAGPFTTKLHHLRKAPIVKTYLCVFICFTTGAIHLELAQNLTTNEFIDVLRRFMSRRSAPAHLYSDCGTNFVGAAAQLKKEWQEWVKSSSEEILHFTSLQGVRFHFLPPASPHMGGLWERAVKSAKLHLYRIVGSHTLTVMQLSSLFTRIEGILNSRPLTPISSDPSDLEVLTPAHFLVGRPMVAPPEPKVCDNLSLLLKHNLIQGLTQRFWERWKAEYLPSVRARSKWTKETPNLKVNSLVLLSEPNSPPLSWPLGRIVEVYPGSDGVVRRARVRTSTGTYLRPAVRLFPLPNQD